MRCLQGFQSMTQACGMLELSDSRDAYLISLCGHTLTDTSTLDHTHAGKAEGVMSPTGGPLLYITLMLTYSACKADCELNTVMATLKTNARTRCQSADL